MYPLVDVETPNIFPQSIFRMMRFQRLPSMTESCLITCRMKSGLQIQHSGMVNSHVPHTVRSRS